MKIAIASDHAALEMKADLVAWLGEQGHEVADLGPHTADSVDYPDYGYKLAAAIALWFSPASTLTFLILMSIAGGVLTLVVVAIHRMKKKLGKPEIPYGVAIAFGALAILTQRFLNQFA